MSSRRHEEALNAFESQNQFDSIQQRLSTFNINQRTIATTTKKKFEWIEEQRRLKTKEIETLKQLSCSINNAIAGLNNEKAGSLFNELVSLSTDCSTLESTANSSLSLAIDVNETIKSLSGNDDAKGVCAQLILEMKQNLAAAEAELEDRYNSLVTEVQECRRSTMKSIADDSRDQNVESLISNRLSAAIADVQVTENKVSLLNNDDDGNYRVNILEHELMQQLIDLNATNTKSSGVEYTMRLQTIEDNGMKAIQNLKKDLESQYKSILQKKEINLKRNDVKLRVQSQLLEYGKITKKRDLKWQEEESEAATKKNALEVRSMERSMLSKQLLWNHRKASNELNSSSKTAEAEALRISKHRVNKERTRHREAQRKGKISCKMKADLESAKAEERRLGRLFALAASVPYYGTLLNITPDIHKTTEARKNDVYTSRDNSLADFQCGLQQLRSFTNDKVFSDSKFRLANALHEAGVARSTYARNVVRDAIPRAKEERTTGIQPY